MASGRIGGLVRGDHSEMSNCPLSPLPSLSMFLGSRQKVSAERGEGSRRWRKQEEAPGGGSMERVGCSEAAPRKPLTTGGNSPCCSCSWDTNAILLTHSPLAQDLGLDPRPDGGWDAPGSEEPGLGYPMSLWYTLDAPYPGSNIFFVCLHSFQMRRRWRRRKVRPESHRS